MRGVGSCWCVLPVSSVEVEAVPSELSEISKTKYAKNGTFLRGYSTFFAVLYVGTVGGGGIRVTKMLQRLQSRRTNPPFSEGGRISKAKRKNRAVGACS